MDLRSPQKKDYILKFAYWINKTLYETDRIQKLALHIPNNWENTDNY